MTIEQGATFSRNMVWKINGNPVDLTGYSARMKMRNKTGVQALSITSSAGGGVTLGSSGEIAILLSATSTSRLSPGKYSYDLELESPDGVVTRLIKGVLTVSAEVTY